jgi:hypothetical protein
MLQSIDRLLAQDGLVYVLAPPILRLILRVRLNRAGFETWHDFLHLPDRATSRYLLPLLKLPAEYGLSHLFPTRLWLRLPFLLLMRAPGGSKLLGAILTQVSFVAYRRQARKPFTWAAPEPQQIPAPESVILLCGGGGKAASRVVQCFSAQRYPAYIAKVSGCDEAAARQTEEVSMLRSVSSAALEAGATIPVLLKEGRIGSCRVLFESALPGRSAAIALADQPRKLEDVLERLFDWLLGWNRRTCKYQAAGAELVEQAILSPARQLARFLRGGDRYLGWLEQHCTQIKGLFPLVTAHNDLTMWNILIEAGSLGVVDWEEARQEYFPLVDFYYALTDALLVSRKARSRQKACEAWLAPWGAFHHLARRFFPRFQEALAIPQAYADLCLHICFLRHAINELGGNQPGVTQPFFQTLEWLSLHHTETREWLHG